MMRRHNSQGVSASSIRRSRDASCDEILDDIGQPTFVAIKAGDHGCQHFVGVHLVDVGRISRIVGQQSKEGELRSAVTFAESMDCI
jgi:hypothetical protein